MNALMVWENLQSIFTDRSIERYNKKLPLCQLCIAIIVSGAREYDREYLGSDQYYYHCLLAGLQYNFVTDTILYAWRKYPGGEGSDRVD